MKSYKIILTAVVVIALLPACNIRSYGETDMVRGAYSGWRIGEIVADLARKSGLNIVGDFGDRKAAGFSLKGEVYIEEALSILARTNGMQVRKGDDLWVFVPDKAAAAYDQSSGVVKELEFKSVADVRDTLTEAGKTGVNIWFPPGMNRVALVGNRTMVDEYKKLCETIDVPDWTLQCNYALLDDSNRMLASCTFNALNRAPFRLVHENTSGPSFELNGVLICNDDGVIAGEEKLKLRFKGAEYVSGITQISREKQISEQTLEIAGSKLRLTRRITLLNGLKGRIMPDNQLPVVSGPAAENFAAPVPARPDGFIVISGPQSPLLDKPLILENVALPEILEKLAADEKIPLICDEHISGRVSAYCHGKRLDKDELIRAFASLHGFYAYKNEDGYTVTTRKGFDNLSLNAEEAYVSPELKRISSLRAQRILAEWLDSAGMPAVIKPVQGNRLSVAANEPWLKVIRAVLEQWAMPVAEFKTGAVLSVDSRRLEVLEKLSELKPVKQAWKMPAGNAQLMLQHKLGSFASGLRQLSFSLNAVTEGKGRWMLQSSTSVPGDDSRSLFAASGCLPIELKLAGNINSPEEETFSPASESDNPFDEAFDSQF